MLDFCFFCITYQKDFVHLEKMLQSFSKHNCENIPLFIALQGDTDGLSEKIKNYKNVTLMRDSDFAAPYLLDLKTYERLKNPTNCENSANLWNPNAVNLEIPKNAANLTSNASNANATNHANLPLGYINQEIAKLAFFESGIARHYLCVDSDTIFIRDFAKSDFFYDKETPYIVLVEDKDLLIAPHYRDFGKIREQNIQKIFSAIGLSCDKIRTCHGLQILSSVVLSDFKEHFMKPNALNYTDLILYSPFEFSWYNAWFMKSGIIKEIAVEPFFKVYHTKAQFVLDKLAGQTLDGIKSRYIGVIFNSNWASGKELEILQKSRILDRILFKILKTITP